ncbi:NAD(P)/FAD-dependent oxidoreductase [Rhizobium sp. KVB221]|uniref:Pyridine nucleotide-disulfide oxidoreductase domain-containing protein 2 n=1 Tax=Rhizobium setariae TaxID=2801340 RepID=A0A936YN12_9HYPH|nr:NAD(P)/FAD-dependent oxidoreductase [Rhizobium setariae]MBL0373450.1 NAD(P)/FAD-dependent oxidoreductase [Rhizobium setariae]
MSSSSKVIVVGAGHNGLVAAAYLAKAGLEVTVVEARDVVGGAAVTEEIIPGYRMSVASFVVGLLRPEVIEDLQLSRHGLELYASNQAISCTIFDDGSNFLMWKDLDRTLKEIRAKYGKNDLEGFMQFGMDMQRLGEIIGPTIMSQPPSLSSFVKSFEDASQQALFERFITGSVRDLVERYFTSRQLQSHFVFPGLVSMYGGPATPGTAYLLAHHCVGEFMGQFGMWGYARGGMGSITRALADSATAAGATVRTNAAVRRIVTRRGEATGVELEGGEIVAADLVISNADPHRTFFGLVGEENLPPVLSKSIQDYDMRGTMARVYLAVDRLPEFIGFGSSQPGPEHEGHLFLGPSMDLFEDGWDAQRRGRIPEQFALEALIDTVRDNSFAPSGHHVITLGVQQLPFALLGSDWDSEKERFTKRVVETFLHYAPNLRGHILAAECRTPLDWERTYRLTGGNIYQGAMSLSRLMGGRPGELRKGYAAPIGGLYLCGAGTHPGGGVMGASGFNAAMAVLTDLGMDTPRPWLPRQDDVRQPQQRRSLAAMAFDNEYLRPLMASLATTPLARPIGKLLTRGRTKRT